ncbi:sacsin N-terminal ATP-binding-like domain-containing protein [Rhizobium leguminosarum]|uniref:sacsin N-terminal ATP-binding-like domain-containing protein n=1 Tax=Rhizobium leguminosarum TaxID=384 RepID=UPI001C952AA7|nr:hypothetical protein [Rhizobium leguminosarum]MBY5657288.1 hypothetical protein [Rhizobium leguminosarum]
MSSLGVHPEIGSSTQNAEWGDTSAEEWKSFLLDEMEATKNAYYAKPPLLVRDYNAEKATVQDYADRELLELVQNAADAATEIGGDGRIRIEIKKNGLLVANTGQPFRTTGVRSLMTSHLSDKPARQRSLIGAKGLGFRSILNWTMEPIVLSGALQLAFSARHSATVLSEMSALHPEFADALGDVSQRVAPILPFPAFGNQFDRALASGHSAELLSRAISVKEDGYDTVIAAGFSNESSFARAAQQAAEFRPEFLLFVPSLRQIEICVEGQVDQRWTKSNVSRDVWTLEIVAGHEVSSQKWICRHSTGEIPRLPDAGSEAVTRYEASVAFRSDEPSKPGMLHCFFPTSTQMPLPALFHATFEVTSNRKQLQDASKLNVHVLERLAELYAHAVSDLVSAGRMNAPLWFLSASGEFPPALKVFETHLYSIAGRYPVIPTLDGSFVDASRTNIGPEGYGVFFPPRLFPKSANCKTLKERALLQLIGVSQLETGATLSKLARMDLTLEERAEVIVGLAKQGSSFSGSRSFLIDESERPFGKRNSCFPPPIGSKMPALPRWAQRRFMHPGLWQLIVSKLEVSRRDIIAKLRNFNVEEYNLDGVTRSLVRQAEELIARHPGSEDSVRTETLQTLQRLYRREGENRPKFPQLRVKVRTQANAWSAADEVHLSESYGLEGRINQALYVSHPEILLEAADPSLFISDELQAFYEWIGVNRWPRMVMQETPLSMRAAVLASLPEQVTVTDGFTMQTIPRGELGWTHTAKFAMQTIDRLDGILATANGDSILAWVARDPRFSAISPVTFSLKLQARRSNSNYRPYDGPLPDPVRWQIKNVAWLSCTDGKRRPPVQTMRDAARLRGVFAQPTRPAEGSEDTLGLDDAAWARALLTVGVPTNIDDLTEAQVFTLLIELKDRGLEPDVVRRLYMQILEREIFRADQAPREKASFERGGYVQCRHRGQFAWVKVSDAYYADRDGLLATARDQLALIDLPTRRNAANVFNRFCVAPLSRQGLVVSVVSKLEARQATDLIAHRFSSARPFIRAYRSLIAPDATAIRRFDRLSVLAVSKLDIEINLGGGAYRGELPAWSHLIEHEQLIVIVDDTMDAQQLLLLASEAIGDGLADIFEVQSGADFTKLLSPEQDSTRRLLLHRMLPNFSDAEVDALFEDQVEPVDTVLFNLTLLENPNPNPPPSPPNGNGLPTESATASGSPTTPMTPTPPSGNLPSHGARRSPDAVTAQTVANPPSAATGRKLDIRVSSGGGYYSSGWSSDVDNFKAVDAEEWAVLFEKSEKRFPLKVAHLQGSAAFGCDVLSFQSQEEFELFKLDGDRRRIARFIEVKSGGVRLTENETRCARQVKSRFFIYRIVFPDTSRTTATLTSIQDPLRYASALARELSIDIDEVADRTTFSVSAVGSVEYREEGVH